LLDALTKDSDKALRIWVPGCSTGEEVYSIAITVQESMHKLELARNIQIFGTDLDDKAIAIARAGRYAESMEGVSAERLQRWFMRDGNEYCPIKKIREMCIFSQHSIIKDPPFSQVDLISCRNVLIYLNTELQDKVLRIFHYALRTDGYLFLGPAEGVTRNSSLFSECDKKHRIFQRRNNDTARPGFKFAARKPRSGQNQLLTKDAHSSGDRLDRIGRRIIEK
jgi:two-component system CheB/CheR fusion protein